MQGFAPADEVLLFRQKDPKPFPPVRGPSSSLRCSRTPAAAELASLKQSSPNPRSPLRFSATPKAGATVQIQILFRPRNNRFKD